jgi:integrase
VAGTATVVPYVTKSGERRWAVRWRDASGRQRWKAVPGRKRNAEKVAQDISQRLALGPLYEAEPETLGVFLAAWLDRYKQRVRASTYRRRVEALRSLGVLTDTGPLSGEYLQRLTVAALEDAVAAVAARAPRQAQIGLATLKMALRNARERGQRVDERLLAIEPPRYDERRPRFLSWPEVERLQSWMPEYVCRIVPVAALTGAALGELFSLTERDLDLEAATMRIRVGKTAARTRTIDLPATAVTLLREQLLARKHTEGGLIFPAPKGGRWTKDNFGERVFRPATRRAKLEGVRFHDLRHTFASLLIAASSQQGLGQAVTVKTGAEQMGHKDGGVLFLRRYGHLFAGSRRGAAAALDGLVQAAKKSPETLDNVGGLQ